MAKVRATRIGFFGSLRYPGDEFEIPDDYLKGKTHPSWIEVLEGPVEEVAAPVKAKPHPAKGREAPRPTAPVPVVDGAAIPLGSGKLAVQPTPI